MDENGVVAVTVAVVVVVVAVAVVVVELVSGPVFEWHSRRRRTVRKQHLIARRRHRRTRRRWAAAWARPARRPLALVAHGHAAGGLLQLHRDVHRPREDGFFSGCSFRRALQRLVSRCRPPTPSASVKITTATAPASPTCAAGMFQWRISRCSRRAESREASSMYARSCSSSWWWCCCWCCCFCCCSFRIQENSPLSFVVLVSWLERDESTSGKSTLVRFCCPSDANFTDASSLSSPRLGTNVAASKPPYDTVVSVDRCCCLYIASDPRTFACMRWISPYLPVGAIPPSLLNSTSYTPGVPPRRARSIGQGM